MISFSFLLYFKGKFAIYVVCNPFGKSGGAPIQQFMILTFGSLANSTPYLGGILLVIVLAWLVVAWSLDSQFTPLVKKYLKRKYLEGKLSATKLIVLQIKETLDKKGNVVKYIVEEGELVKENEKKTKEMDVVEVRAHRSPYSRSP